MTVAFRIAVLIAGVVALAFATTSVDAQGVTLGVDADTAGSSAAKLGPIQSCRTVQAGDTFDVDVYVTDVSALTGFEFQLQFNADVLQVSAVNDKMFLASISGSNIISFTERPPGQTTGSLSAAAADFGESGTTEESGSGVLTRFTLKAAAKGKSTVSIAEPKLAANVGGNPASPVEPVDGQTFIGPVFSANIAVGESCTPPPSPTPNPKLTPTNDGQAPGGTPVPGGPGTEPGTTPGAGEGTPGAPGQTPGPATPGAGSPGAGGTPGTNANGEGGGGLGTGGWIGIGVAIAAGALAAAGGGWWIWRRRQALP